MSSGVTNLTSYIHQEKPLWNSLAILYTLSGYIGGIALILQSMVG